MIYDITPPITPELKVWPGDTPPTREVLMDMKLGATVTLSTFRGTVHLGAHADGPNHYGRDAPGIDARPLEDYLGPCQVVDAAIGRGERVDVGHLAARVSAARVLIRTRTFPDPTAFNEDFAGISPGLIDHLHARGVRLVGIDTPSVDLFDSKDLPSHRACLRHGLAILEGLDLSAVPPGNYELIALPLRLVGFDASPVRAVLRTADRPAAMETET